MWIFSVKITRSLLLTKLCLYCTVTEAGVAINTTRLGSYLTLSNYFISDCTQYLRTLRRADNNSSWPWLLRNKAGYITRCGLQTNPAAFSSSSALCVTQWFLPAELGFISLSSAKMDPFLMNSCRNVSALSARCYTAVSTVTEACVNERAEKAAGFSCSQGTAPKLSPWRRGWQTRKWTDLMSFIETLEWPVY